MKVDGVIGGQILYWEMSPRTMLRLERIFGESFESLAKEAAQSSTIQNEMTFAGFYSKTGEALTKEYLNELAAKDPDGFIKFGEALKDAISPPKIAPLSETTSNGANSD